jgi:sarcosine/dimethylglycine N-methyltransferase
MNDATTQTVYFYDRHPISCDIILAKLQASRGHLDGLRPDELFPHDQDHYGGPIATDELAQGACIGNGSRVADFCAGLGGTVRYLAHRYGANVTGIELTPARVAGAQELTGRVGLQETARVIEGNVLEVPLADASMDAVVSQEAFCHVPDLKKALVEAFRILRTDGRLAFTDWIAHEPLTAADVQLMWDGMAIQPLRSIPDYRHLVESSGLRVLSATDLTDEWGPILRERLAMYQRLREEARQAGTPTGHDAFHRSYVRFVELIQQRKLGGIRIVALKQAAV